MSRRLEGARSGAFVVAGRQRLLLLAPVALVGLAVLLLGVAQLVLPAIAEQSVRDRLARSGHVLSVQVRAFPALELLWHRADSVVVRLGRYRSPAAQLGATIAQANDVGSLSVSVGELDTGLLTLRQAKLRKQGSRLTGTAEVTEADLRSALPILQAVRLVASSGGGLTLRGTATLFGFSATVDAAVRARDGAIFVAPKVPFGALAPLRIFSDPHVEVQSIGAQATAAGFSITAGGRLR